ncbi:hypothetical protein HYH03_017497, partial [Edaphochlamys debaryana]
AGNAGVCLLLAALTALLAPCCIAAVNIVRGTGFVAAGWSQVVSVVALRLSPDVFVDPASRQWYTSSWTYVEVLVAGWGVIALAGGFLLRRHLVARRGSTLAFSLRGSPFNYTLLAEAGRGRGGAAGAAEAPGSWEQPAATGAFRETRGAAGADTRTSAEKQATRSSDDGKRDSDGEDASGSEGSAGEEGFTPPPGGGEGKGRPSSAGAAAAACAALGLPDVSPALLRELGCQGLLSPADEMRAFMAQLVAKAERRLDKVARGGGGSGSDSEEDWGGEEGGGGRGSGGDESGGDEDGESDNGSDDE